MLASVLVAKFGNGEGLRNGREMAACLELAPKQNSAGGKQKLGPISRHGDKYLRTLAIQGAKTALRFAEK